MVRKTKKIYLSTTWWLLQKMQPTSAEPEISTDLSMAFRHAPPSGRQYWYIVYWVWSQHHIKTIEHCVIKLTMVPAFNGFNLHKKDLFSFLTCARQSQFSGTTHFWKNKSIWIHTTARIIALNKLPDVDSFRKHLAVMRSEANCTKRFRRTFDALRKRALADYSATRIGRGEGFQSSKSFC